MDSLSLLGYALGSLAWNLRGSAAGARTLSITLDLSRFARVARLDAHAGVLGLPKFTADGFRHSTCINGGVAMPGVVELEQSPSDS